jgi:hypothetical protein
VTSAAVIGAALIACKHSPPAPLVKDQLHQMTATVQTVNVADRTVVLVGPDGAPTEVSVGPEVRNFEQVKPGDHVVVSYYEGFAAEVKPSSTATSTPEQSVATARSAPGQPLGAGAGRTLTSTVEIQSVDTSDHKVTFQRADGISRVVAVEDPDAQKFVEHLKPGDKVQITYTEAVAVNVKPAQ